jgi:hypothetical protein
MKDMEAKLRGMRDDFIRSTSSGTNSYRIPDRFVVVLDGKHYLISCDGVGNIEQASPIQVIEETGGADENGE